MELMRELDEASVDAICTDPPYGIRFMGKTWDGAAIEKAAQQKSKVGAATRLTGSPDSPNRKLIARTGSAFENEAGAAGAYDFSLKGNRAFQAWCEAWATEALRVLKPGGHLLAFGGTRTYHRLACAIEDAGFEIRDCLAWMFGSGFPKSLDVSKAIDKAAGVERDATGPSERNWGASKLEDGKTGYGDYAGEWTRTEPATPEAQRWNGWGTALKPAHEPIVVARKPLGGTVAANVLEYGTGALNVDGCRIGTEGATTRGDTSENHMSPSGAFTTGHDIVKVPGLGRWPANVVLDEESARLLDAQTGESVSRIGRPGRAGVPGEGWGIGTKVGTEYDDQGGASRFFYVAKASRAERAAGLGSSCVCGTVKPWDEHEDPEALPPRATSALIEEDDFASSTSGSGSRPTDPSQKGSKSTTETASRPTTDSKTSRSSPRSTTSESTPRISDEQRPEAGRGAVGSAVSGSPRPASTTTSAERDGSSTDAAALATSGASSLRSASEERCANCGEVVGGWRNSHPT